MGDSLQEGIYFRQVEPPGSAWRLLLIDFNEACESPEEAGCAIEKIWNVIDGLKRGVIGDLSPDDSEEQTSQREFYRSLTCLIGYGETTFNRRIPVVKPEYRKPPVVNLNEAEAKQPFRSLHWARRIKRRPSVADFGLQFIADTELAVNRAVVEVYKLIADENLPLRIVYLYSGFGREDRRNWLDFFDSVNNMRVEERLKAIEFRPAERHLEWMNRGTFMAFLRIEISLSLWRGLKREQQELIIGRDKLSGCPFKSTACTNGAAAGVKLELPAVDFLRDKEPPLEYLNPPRPSEGDMLLKSHIHRANLHRNSDPAAPGGNRIFRQGFDFLEMGEDGDLSLGLNFISFQSSIERIRDILDSESWLGGVNFGGESGSASAPDLKLLSLIAGCYFAVPPAAHPFPGYCLFR